VYAHDVLAKAVVSMSPDGLRGRPWIPEELDPVPIIGAAEVARILKPRPVKI
jgi:hypothetical protein